MKWLFVLYLFMCAAPTANAQDIALRIPTAETYSSAAIARYIQANFTTDRQKLHAIYSWVTANIRYSTDSMYNINWGPDPEIKVSAALRRKKGVCENFAAVFTDIALKCNIPSFVVSGFTTASKASHSWSAAYIDSTWFLCDPTWDIGYGNDTKYFLIQPDEFIESHMPFDPLWQLLPYPITQQQFFRGNTYGKKERQPWNVNDSVNSFLQLDSLHQLEASASRMKQADSQNNAANIWQQFVHMKIAIVYGDKDMDLYNGAVADLNEANTIFNNFVQYRNNQFTPAKPDATVAALLDPIPGLIAAANRKVSKIGEKVENVQYDTGSLKSRLKGLSAKVLAQQHFLKLYLESAAIIRQKLFYSTK